MVSERVTFAAVLRIREFRVLWVADAQSAIGDQIARVALSVLVFERTESALLTALAYALTFVPAMLGGVLLSGLADRLPRRQVMVGCDVIRAVLLACMAIPRVPIWVLCGLLVVAVLTEAPFMAAESSLMPIILDGEYYIVGTGLRTITNQLAQLAGFAGGGLVIALIGARAGLALDAATFAVSAVLIMLGVKARPAAVAEHAGHAGDPSFLSGLFSGLRLIFTNPRLRILIGLSWLAGLFVVPEGVAAPYAHDLGGGPVAVGLLMAATPAGTAVGTYLWVRFVPSTVRSRWMGPMAAAVGVPMVLCAVPPEPDPVPGAVDGGGVVLRLPGTGDHRVRPNGARSAARAGDRHRILGAAGRAGLRHPARRCGGRVVGGELGRGECRPARHAAGCGAFLELVPGYLGKVAPGVGRADPALVAARTGR